MGKVKFIYFQGKFGKWEVFNLPLKSASPLYLSKTWLKTLLLKHCVIFKRLVEES